MSGPDQQVSVEVSTQAPRTSPRPAPRTCRDSIRKACTSTVVQWPLALALLVPLAATIGQFSDTRFWTESIRFQLLFWPGQDWSWGPVVPVWMSMGLIAASYVVAIAWIMRRRTLTTVILVGAAGLIAASLAGNSLNALTGWKELQMLSSMNLAGKANRAIFSLWHNPVWEELIFRGIPLGSLLLWRKRFPGPFGWPEGSYLVLPSIGFALYHIPGHGPSRILDTFILGLLFGWLALRFSFFAPLVLHYIFDAMMVPQLGKLPGIPRNEITWLADHAATLNTVWTLAILGWLLLMPFLALKYRIWRALAQPLTSPVGFPRD